jgi:hypothetical protein
MIRVIVPKFLYVSQISLTPQAPKLSFDHTILYSRVRPKEQEEIPPSLFDVLNTLGKALSDKYTTQP